MSAGARLAGMTWPDAETHARRAVLVPLGALEQHGPHLPLDTDTRIAAAVAAAVASRRPEVAVAPALAFGASGEHASFPGTLSIGTAALEHLLLELGRDAAAHWDALLFVNAHGGNAAGIGAAVGALRAEGRRCSVYHAGLPRTDAHAGRAETSLMLHLAPDAVRAGRLTPGDPRPLAALLPELRRDGVRAVSPNGVLGDPRGATAAEGASLLARMAAACTSRLATLLEREG